MIPDDDLWFAPIRFQRHAEARIAERLGLREQDARHVVGEIRCGLLLGRFTLATPAWCGGHPGALGHGNVYVWGDAFSHCYVLGRATHTLFLVTVLLEETNWRGRVERGRGVRTGSVRA